MVALESEDILEQGDEAPAFELHGTNDSTYSLEHFQSYEAVLIVFTCNHCPYAKAKFDEMNRLTEEYDEVAIVGINPNNEDEYPEDDLETMQELVDDGTIQWDAYLRDARQEIAASYGATCTPDPYLFENDDGTFRLAYHGRLDDALNPDDEPETREMKGYIDTVLAGEDITDSFAPSRGCSIKWRDGNEPNYWD